MNNIVSVTNLINSWVQPRGIKKLLVIALLLGIQFLVGGVVYLTGGTKFAYLHLMYFPIFLGSLLFGVGGGIIFGSTGGLILGPYMPIETSVMSMQPVENWSIRVIFFVIIGSLMGIVLELLINYLKHINTITFYNTTTGLHNRKYFENAKFDDVRGYFLALLKIENHSKAISSLGYDVTSEIIKKFADKLNHIDCRIENGEIFHFSDNQFAILLKEDSDENGFKGLSNILRSTIKLEEAEFYPEVSLGIAKYNRDNLELIKKAEMARIFARKNLLDFYLFIPEVSKKDIMNFELFSEIPRALKKKEFFLCFQPKVDVRSQKLEGAEVLIRWMHPTKGIIRPDEFIPYLETTTFINKITQWIMWEALKAISLFKREGIDINLSVNIPIKYIKNPAFIDSLKGFKSLGLPLHKIEIEVLERDLIEDFSDIASAMNEIKTYGPSFSLDDFGTGYSSISYIKKLPFDKIKIDKMFVTDITTNQENRDIVRSSIELAHTLRVTALAEGVEDEDAFNILHNLKCDYIQGYYLSKPIRDIDFIDWCKRSASR